MSSNTVATPTTFLRLTTLPPMPITEALGTIIDAAAEGSFPFGALPAPDYLAEAEGELCSIVDASTPEPMAARIAVLLSGAFPQRGQGASDEYLLALTDEFGRYAPAIGSEAARQIRRSARFLPSIAVVVETCDRIEQAYRTRLRGIDRLRAEHERRRIVDTERASRQRQDQGWFSQLGADIAERFGVDALQPGDVELGATAILHRLKTGHYAAWRAGLAAGERWPVTLCRRMAVLERAMLAGMAEAEVAAVARLVLTDEAAARSIVAAAGATAEAGPAAGESIDRELEEAIRAIERTALDERLAERQTGEPETRAQSVAGESEAVSATLVAGADC